jgi:hypothetical protein
LRHAAHRAHDRGRQLQTDDTQRCPDAQVTPHAPQFISSLLVFTHAPLQTMFEHVHVPPLQTNPGPHVWPHDPQFRSSVPVFTQAEPH